jgi:YD repeat-containing protein
MLSSPTKGTIGMNRLVKQEYNAKTFTLSYDEQDQLVKSYLDSNDVDQYMYDASGERTLRRTTSGGVTTLTVYAFGLEEYQYSSSGTPQNATHSYSLGGRLVGSLSGLGNNPSAAMYVTDAQGSVLASYSKLAGDVLYFFRADDETMAARHIPAFRWMSGARSSTLRSPFSLLGSMGIAQSIHAARTVTFVAEEVRLFWACQVWHFL